MKKLTFFLLLCIISISIHATTPKQYVEQKYGDRAVLFTEDVDDWLDQETVGDKSQIVFYNSTSEDIEFELHELQTSFNQVKKDIVRKIKGRETVKIKAGEHFVPAMTFEDIEHIAFVFKESNSYDILAYADNIFAEQYSSNSVYGFTNNGVGFISGNSESRITYSVVFEIVKKAIEPIKNTSGA